MRMDYSYNLTQEQKLILTHEMQLSIKVLQMSANELREYINDEFAENPILEMQENISNSADSKNKELDKYDYKEMIKYLEFDNYGAQSFGSYDDEEISPFNFISEKKSLKEYLYEQINEIEENDLIISIAGYIIESLDHRGYLEISVEEIAKEINIDKALVEEALEVVQDLEPYGIGARNLKECLKIQLINLGLIDDILEKIVDDNLEDIANSRYGNIAKSLNISPREAQRYGDIIRKLEPKPSRGFFTGEDVKFIIPDAEIRNIQGEFYIIMNDGILPKLSVNNAYKEVLNTNADENTTEYVKEKLNKAISIVKSIEQRRSTLYKVLEKIVEKQKDFLLKGINYIKPMTLKEISEDIKMHESTVSRAIKDKYILTSFGTIKIKDLFVSKLSVGKNDEDVAVTIIKKKIKDMIDNENKKKPLSDQVICDNLNDEKINISRRTVAKYREELGIQSSSKRKRI